MCTSLMLDVNKRGSLGWGEEGRGSAQEPSVLSPQFSVNLKLLNKNDDDGDDNHNDTVC